MLRTGFLFSASSSCLSLSAGPMSKRPRLEVVKRLNFEPDMEELLYPDSPPGDITPPPSPEVFPEMLDAGCVV